MNIHEYQAKEILRGYGVPIPPGEIATTPAEAEAIATKYGTAVMVKAQVHAGGRGKAGGVKFCKTPADAKEKATAILENPFYIALSSSFSGTQEYMAMEKLGQIHAQAQQDGSYDLIIVDTPPSRSALDFLDAPERLSSFLDGRFIRLLLTPARS